MIYIFWKWIWNRNNDMEWLFYPKLSTLRSFAASNSVQKKRQQRCVKLHAHQHSEQTQFNLWTETVQTKQRNCSTTKTNNNRRWMYSNITQNEWIAKKNNKKKINDARALSTKQTKNKQKNYNATKSRHFSTAFPISRKNEWCVAENVRYWLKVA